MDANRAKWLADIQARLAPLLLAEARSKELAPKIPPARLFIAICGVGVGFNSCVLFDDFLSIRKITNPPGIVHVTRAADLQYSDYLAVSRYSHSVQAEIAVGNAEMQESDHFYMGIAWHTAALLKLRGYSSLFCPALSSESWDVVNAISDNSIKFRMLDDIPRQIVFPHEQMTISTDDVKWVKTQPALCLKKKNTCS
jgi:hypothetical protein